MQIAPLHPREEERLLALAEVEILDTPPEAAYSDIAGLASSIVGAPIALVNFVDRSRVWVKATIGLDIVEAPRELAFCSHTILEEDLLEVEDIRADPRFSGNPLVEAPPHFRFYAGVPLRLGDDLPLGTLCTLDHVPRRLAPAQAEALRALGRQVVANLELRRTARRAEAVARALRQSEARNRALLAASPDGMIRVARDGTVLDRKFGRDHAILPAAGAELGGRLSSFLPAPLEALFMQHMQRALASGEVESFEYVETTGERPCDKELRILASGPDEVLALVRDITDRKQSERAKDEFVATVSHELRTPLTSIRGSLGLLEHGVAGELAPEAAELVRLARSNADRLIAVISDILDLEKSSAGKLALSLAPHSPGRLVETALGAIRGMADEAGVELAAEVRARSPVRADEGRIIQVLNNLLSNAIKYSPRGARVTVSAGPGAPGRTRFAVRDRGPGIATEHHARIFGRFQQVDASDSRERGGTGLGLAIVKRMVEEHGGEVGLDSAPGRGSTFWFELPDAEAAA